MPLELFSAKQIHLCYLAIFTFCKLQPRAMGCFTGGHKIYLTACRRIGCLDLLKLFVPVYDCQM